MKTVYEAAIHHETESAAIHDAYVTLCKAGLTQGERDSLAPTILRLQEETRRKDELWQARHENMEQLRSDIRKINPHVIAINFRYWAPTPKDDCQIDKVTLYGKGDTSLHDEGNKVSCLLRTSDDGILGALGYAFRHAYGVYRLLLDDLTLTRLYDLRVPVPDPQMVNLPECQRAFL